MSIENGICTQYGNLSNAILKPRSLTRMKSKPQFHEISSIVLVRRVAKEKARSKALFGNWGYVAKIVEVFQDKYLYRIEWQTQGPTLKDEPGTIAT